MGAGYSVSVIIVAKRNKIRYQSKGNQYPALTVTGRVFLRHADDEIMHEAQKGDIQIYLSTDSILHNTHLGNYEAVGFEGYLKADIFDGKGWKPLSLEEVFPGRKHYFSKRERPLDTYHVCLGALQDLKGMEAMRTYREHYRIEERQAEND